jgi:hypothetical protein
MRRLYPSTCIATTWSRERLFDHPLAQTIFGMVQAAGVATVVGLYKLTHSARKRLVSTLEPIK